MLMPVKICLYILGVATPVLIYLTKITNLQERGHYTNKKIDKDENPSRLYQYFDSLTFEGKKEFFDYHLKVYNGYVRGNYDSYKMINEHLLTDLDKELMLTTKPGSVFIQTKTNYKKTVMMATEICENRREMAEIDFKTILARREMLKERLKFSKEALKQQFSREGFTCGN